MSNKPKEITIEGEVYVDTNAVDELLGGVLSPEAIREMGKQWNRQKVGNRYFYRKADVSLPHYPLAVWQRMTLVYMTAAFPPEHEKVEVIRQFIERDDYYYAQTFLKAAMVEKVESGKVAAAGDMVDFALLRLGRRGLMHVVVSDRVHVVGRQLTVDEYRRIDNVTMTRLRDGTAAGFHVWDVDMIAGLAAELLSGRGGAA